MIFKRRISAALVVLLCGVFAATESSDDFKFDSDDLQVRITRPTRINYFDDNVPTWQLISNPVRFHRSFIRIPQKLSWSLHHAMLMPKRLHNARQARARWCLLCCSNRSNGAMLARERKKRPLRSCHVSSWCQGWVKLTSRGSRFLSFFLDIIQRSFYCCAIMNFIQVPQSLSFRPFFFQSTLELHHCHWHSHARDFRNAEAFN